jgi:hypothetical protein
MNIYQRVRNWWFHGQISEKKYEEIKMTPMKSHNKNMMVSELDELKYEDISDDDLLLISDMDSLESKKLSINTLKKLINV